jgi:hypothetical protein
MGTASDGAADWVAVRPRRPRGGAWAVDRGPVDAGQALAGDDIFSTTTSIQSTKDAIIIITSPSRWQCSDWAARPLAREQRAYAAASSFPLLHLILSYYAEGCMALYERPYINNKVVSSGTPLPTRPASSCSPTRCRQPGAARSSWTRCGLSHAPGARGGGALACSPAASAASAAHAGGCASRLRPSRGRYSHSHAALYILYGESLMKYTRWCENDFTAHRG